MHTHTNHQSYLLILIFLSYAFVISQTHMGPQAAGRQQFASHPRHRHHGGSPSSSSGSQSGMQSSNCKMIGGTTTCDYSQGKVKGWSSFGILAMLLACIGLCLKLTNKNEHQKRMEKIVLREMKEFEAVLEDKKCRLTEEEK